jgi:hypothetical protein
VQAGDGEHRLVDAIAFEAAVPEHLPVLQAGQDMLQPRLSSAVHFVFCLVLRAQTPVTMPFAVWDERTGAW